MFNILLIICIFIFSNRYFYILAIKVKGKILLKNQFLKEINLVFHNPIFLVSLPTNDHKLYTSLPKDYKISYDFESFLFPKLVGIKVYYKNSSDNRLIFYSKITNISLNGEISKKTILTHTGTVGSNIISLCIKNSVLENICIHYLIFDKKKQSFIKQEVCRQLRERN